MFRRLLIAILLTITTYASEVDWAHDYADAAAHAAESGKNIFVLMTTETCKWCRKLEEQTLTDPTVAARINASYVSVQVTRNVDDYPGHLQAKLVPTSFFLRPDGSLIHDMIGYWGVEDYLSVLDDVEFELKKEQ